MLDKAIKYGKEHRKPYRKAKAVDKQCRNHGDCPYCKSNRLHNSKKHTPLPFVEEDFEFLKESESIENEN